MTADFVCNMCGKQFMAKKALSDHNSAVHKEVESPCNNCDKSFRKKKQLTFHIKNVHAEKQKFYSDTKSGEILCIYYSTSKSNLRSHKKSVHETSMDDIPKKNVCALCGYKTNKKFNLNKHSVKCNKNLDQNPTDHTCNFCSKTFATKKIFSDFVLKWKILEDCFGTGCTLKIHIIDTHLVDVLKDTGKTLHDKSDEPLQSEGI